MWGLLLVFPALGIECHTKDGKQDCTVAGEETKYAQQCYVDFVSGNKGCIPESQADEDPGEAVCVAMTGGQACSCTTDLCNTDALKSVAVSPTCWVGAGGMAGLGKCKNAPSLLFDGRSEPNCHNRMLSATCVNADDSMGQDPSCTKYTSKEACTGAIEREDGEDCTGWNDGKGCCQWVDAKTDEEKTASCNAVSHCSGDSTSCSETALVAEVRTKRAAAACKARAFEVAGCFENSDDLGDSEACKVATTEDACKAVATEPSCRWVNAVPAGKSPKEACLADDSCTYEAGGRDSPAGAMKSLSDLFNYGLFRPKVAQKPPTCALGMSYRPDWGTLIVGSEDVAGGLRAQCDKATATGGTFANLFEHVGSTPEVWREYCKNIVVGVDAALSASSAKELMQLIKQGRLDVLAESSRGFPYIVHDFEDTADYAKLSCAWFGANAQSHGVAANVGGGFCVCEGVGCNGQKTIETSVNKVATKVLKAVDGSLAPHREQANAVVPDLVDANGVVDLPKFDTATAAQLGQLAALEDNVFFTLAEMEEFQKDLRAMGASRTDYLASLATKAPTNAPTNTPTNAPTQTVTSGTKATDAPAAGTAAPVSEAVVVAGTVAFTSVNVTDIPAGSTGRADFEQKFQSSVATVCNVKPAAVTITAIRAGSVLVDYEVKVADARAAASALTIAAADPTSALGTVGTVDPAQSVAALKASGTVAPKGTTAPIGTGADSAAVAIAFAAYLL